MALWRPCLRNPVNTSNKSICFFPTDDGKVVITKRTVPNKRKQPAKRPRRQRPRRERGKTAYANYCRPVLLDPSRELFLCEKTGIPGQSPRFSALIYDDFNIALPEIRDTMATAFILICISLIQNEIFTKKYIRLKYSLLVTSSTTVFELPGCNYLEANTPT